EFIDRSPHHQAKQRVIDVFKKLAVMNPVEIGAIKGIGDRFAYFHFDEMAQNLFNEWYKNFQEKKIQADDENPILVEHFSKFSSLLPSLALIFHLIIQHRKISSNYEGNHH